MIRGTTLQAPQGSVIKAFSKVADHHAGTPDSHRQTWFNTTAGKTEFVVTVAKKSAAQAKSAIDWRDDHANIHCHGDELLRAMHCCKHLIPGYGRPLDAQLFHSLRKNINSVGTSSMEAAHVSACLRSLLMLPTTRVWRDAGVDDMRVFTRDLDDESGSMPSHHED